VTGGGIDVAAMGNTHAAGTYLIEQRWRERLGDAATDELRQALSSVADPAGVRAAHEALLAEGVLRRPS
jgi:hypothetical protein